MLIEFKPLAWAWYGSFASFSGAYLALLGLRFKKTPSVALLMWGATEVSHELVALGFLLASGITGLAAGLQAHSLHARLSERMTTPRE